MSESAIAAYQTAIGQLQAAQKQVEQYVRIIEHAAGLLNRDGWKTAMMSNVQGGFPAEIAFSRREGINGSDWPTAQQLADALVAWHNAKQAVKNAYQAIHASERSVVQPPDKYV
jgi:hypothetical protein